MPYVLKIILSAALIVAISEISKRSTFFGGLLASLPIVSLFSILWLYIDTKDAYRVSALSRNIFWMVFPSLTFFIALPLFLKTRIGFYASTALSLALMFVSYLLLMACLAKLGVKL